MRCENRYCNSSRLATGYGSSKLFGGLSVDLCVVCLRIWQLDNRVYEIMDPYDLVVADRSAVYAALQGGQRDKSVVETVAAMIEKEVGYLKAARALAVEMFGLDQPMPKESR